MRFGQLPRIAQLYVASVLGVALLAIGFVAIQTDPQASLELFVLLALAAAVMTLFAIELATRRWGSSAQRSKRKCKPRKYSNLTNLPSLETCDAHTEPFTVRNLDDKKQCTLVLMRLQ